MESYTSTSNITSRTSSASSSSTVGGVDGAASLPGNNPSDNTSNIATAGAGAAATTTTTSSSTSLPMNSANASASLPDPDEGFVLSLDDPNHPTNFKKPTINKGKTSKILDVQSEPQYIVGTLIVRVVAAKGLQVPSSFGVNSVVGVFGRHIINNNNIANPYASVKFGNSTQRTSEVFGSNDPVWPRHETMYMDVSLPLTQLTHPQYDDNASSSGMAATASAATSTSASHNNENDNNNNNEMSLDDPYYGYKKPNTILTVAIFHTTEIGKVHKLSTGGYVSGDSDDTFLGVASVDLTKLFTGKISTFDKWLPLHGTPSQDNNDTNKSSMVRIVCEYEPSDIPPKQGDIVRFTRFCHPKDLYPLEPGRPYKVEKVQNVGSDIVLLSYESQEGWVLSFQAHKNMLVCEERHVSALDTAQGELQTLGERLSHSPLLVSVQETAAQVLDEGIVGVAEGIAKGSFSLFDRWFKGGLDTVISDLQDVTNIDGRYNPDTGQRLELSSPLSSSNSHEDNNNAAEEDPPFTLDEEEEEALPNMPPCPITGFPMLEPVVAADGHTYERSAIARWLKASDKSPMTGSVLIHKELVPNYGLMSSVQEAAAREKKERAAAAAAAVAASRAKKPPPPKNDAIQTSSIARDNATAVASGYAKKPPPCTVETDDEEDDEEQNFQEHLPLKSEK